MAKQLNKGQALVEVIFAISLVSVILGGLVAAAIYTQKATRLAQNRAEAKQLAEHRLEYLRGQKQTQSNQFWDNISSYTGTDTDFSTQLQDIFTRQTDISVVGSAPSRRAEVEVIVSWQDGNETRDVTLNT